MSGQKFVDGVQDISIVGGVVRVDFFSYEANAKSEEGQPVPAFDSRLLMSPEGFLQAYAAMEHVVNQLIENGAISRRGDPGEGSAAQTSSPNF